MVKCDVCGQKIQTTFLGKMIGTMIKVDKKKKYACSNCQQEHKDKLIDQIA